jgi:hypothetical protein
MKSLVNCDSPGLDLLRSRRVMKTTILTTIALLASIISIGQKVQTGEYGDLKLAYHEKTKQLTGYFESYAGWDEQAKSPRFSCTFYIAGVAAGNRFKVRTYHPSDKSTDIIEGTVNVLDSKNVSIQLPEEHGGCWNVQHFVEEPVKFELGQEKSWIQIRYIDTGKAYFFSDKSYDKKMKAYVIRSNVVFVDKIENEWAHCSYIGKKTTTGWIQVSDLNRLQ